MGRTKLQSTRQLQQLADSATQERAARGRAPRIAVCQGAGCIAAGGEDLYLELWRRAAGTRVQVVPTGCFGPCAHGPLARIECAARNGQAASTHYANLNASHAEELLRLAVDPEGGSVEDDTALRPISLERFLSSQQKIALRNCGSVDPEVIEDYISQGGYAGLAKALREMAAEEIVSTMKASGLRGRGGAGFPTYLKWDLARRAEGERKYVLCNADEGDPGAFMDRSLLEGDPHSIIEGMVIAARAIGASRGFVYVRAEYPLAVTRLSTAIDQARELGLLGTDILGSGFDFDLEIRKGSGAFVCGEETALMNSIEGKRGEPRPRPPFPAQRGLWGMPSVLNNVETYANVPAIIANGAEWYARWGTAESKGTKVFALAGAIENPGLVEVPIGTTLGELVYEIGGGIKGGRVFKAAQIGGPSGGCVPKEHLNVPLDYHTLAELGAIMGSGGLIVMDDETCMVDVARFFLEFVQEESCGKCVPCRVGTKRMLEIVTAICEGRGQEGDIERLIELGERIRETALCGLGQTAPNPVLSTIRHFRDEYEAHIKHHHCEAGVCAKLVRAPCQSACPAGVDVPGFVSLVGEKRYAEALRLHRERNPFAAVCARVCFHTCEERCRRSAIDSAVAIRGIKRFMVDQEVTIQLPSVQIDPANETRRVAIVGAGPAGLSCAYFLARLGYRPEVFEAEQRPGGMLVQAIPAYRLPRETVAREIRMIEQLGVEIHTDTALGRDFTLQSLRERGFEAVFLGVGAPGNVGLGIRGEDAAGVVMAGEFLKRYNTRGSVPVGKNVVIIGGGNAAIDAARTAMRLGPETVTVVYRRTRDQMPAYAEEIEEALREGIELLTLTQPLEVLTGGGSAPAARALRCSPMALGDFDRSGRRRAQDAGLHDFEILADQIIVAVGQDLPIERLCPEVELPRGGDGFVLVDELTGQTEIPWLFCGGDAARGPASVVSAIADGERAAVGIDLLLSGSSHAFWRTEITPDTAFDPTEDPLPYPREAMRTIEVARRRHNFDEVEQAWFESVALRQARRCLRCDYGKSPCPPVQPTAAELRGLV